MAAEVLDWRPRRGNAKGDRELGVHIEDRNRLATAAPSHRLDSEESRRTLRQLLRWYYFERDRQASNRLEQAIDHDFYDNQQWDEEDASILESRGQAPLVFNEVAPMADWIIGTERRNRVDWKVLPRTEDDVEAADIKTKVLKYVSDVNRTAFARSRAFADAVKGGVGWLDDGVRDDPTQEIIYSKYEDWRNVLWDSSAQELDLTDARYIFRWRWVDEDIACLMFPDRRDRVKSATEEQAFHSDPMEDEDTWTAPLDNNGTYRSRGSIYPLSAGFSEEGGRRRVKLFECQFRMPAASKIVADGPMKGAYFDPRDKALASAIARHGSQIIDKVVMRVHVAVFTESDLLGLGPSIYRHNRFSLTPIWCYRRGKDRLPYGVIRRVRDIQKDLNKRASKALWLMNTNQIVMDEGAVKDIEQAREEAQMPDGVIVKQQGKELVIRRDTDAATGQIQMMALDGQAIQKSAGVAQENMGRQTNAVSGEAIKARQMQGSVVTTEPFDNLRYGVQVQGEKQLSLTEQWFTEEKVIRLTGSKGAIEWVRINTPEVAPDGSITYLNDISASQADFQVSEQDYSGTLRQVMFEGLGQLAQRLPPEVSLRVLRIAMEFSDLPNKQEVADEIRKITGERDETKKLSPEEEQQAAEQAQMQAEAMQLQRESAMTALEEQRAKVRELNARALDLEARAAVAEQGPDGAPNMQAEVERAVDEAIKQASDQIDKLAQSLSEAQIKLADRTLQINKDADTKVQLARIQADTDLQVAEIQAASDRKLDVLVKRIEDLSRSLDEVGTTANEAASASEKVTKAAETAAIEKTATEKAAKEVKAASTPPAAENTPMPAAAAPAAAPAAPQPIVVMLPPGATIPGATGPTTVVPPPPSAAPAGGRSFKVLKTEDGEILGAEILRADGTTQKLLVTRGPDGSIDGGDLLPTAPKKPAKPKKS